MYFVLYNRHVCIYKFIKPCVKLLITSWNNYYFIYIELELLFHFAICSVTLIFKLDTPTSLKSKFGWVFYFTFVSLN